MTRLSRGLLLLAALAGSLVAAAAASARTQLEPPRMTEAVVTLQAPPLASRSLQQSVAWRRGSNRRLDLRGPASVSYLRHLDAARRAVEARVERAVPGSFVRWRYRVVLNGFALVLPAGERGRLASVPGVAHVYASVRYRPLLDRTPAQIGAPALWGPALATAGQGVKIGVVDDGIDQTHPFFAPRGYAMPSGFPKGQAAFTTAKVVVARAFAPPFAGYANASRPFDPNGSFHATHVAGIAAGNHGTRAAGFAGDPTLSGIAPRAYLGNYKVLTVPTPGVGLDGNSAEIAAGIEAAVADGMDVINLSLGEPEVEPSRDLVVRAIDGAADAGVVPVVAAGNDFDEFGRGSIGSPGTAPKAITVGAVTSSRSSPPGIVAGFSSSGPTPISNLLKPDVAAPGVNILSSVPGGARWALFNGTSMASPHVAGAAALLRERHPRWTVAQVKSALVLTGDPAYPDTRRRAEAPTTREGGGLVDLPRADVPEVFAAPSGLSFGLLRRGARAARTVTLADAGGGAGAWTVAVTEQSGGAAVTVTAPASVAVPGALRVQAATAATASAKEATGFVVLSRGTARRRIPYWLGVSAPRLAGEPHRTLARPGVYRGDTRGKPARVSSYRYPEGGSGVGVRTRLAGPEQVFRVVLRRPAANFGVAVLSQSPGTAVHPRVVRAGDENRLVGYPGLPLNLNPYLDSFLRPEPVAGAVLPARGAYDVVFDTASRARAGRFTFRFWIGDTTPPSVRLLTRRPGSPLHVAVADRGSGVDPRLLSVRVDGRRLAGTSYDRRSGRITIPVRDLAGGRHTLVVQASDHQETRNMEDVPRILPNTRVLRASFAR